MILATAAHTGAAVGGGMVLVLLLSGICLLVSQTRRFCGSGIPLPQHLPRLRLLHWSTYDVLLIGVLVISSILGFAALGYWLQHGSAEKPLLHLVAASQNTFLQVFVGGVLFYRMRHAGGNIQESFGVGSGETGRNVRWVLEQVLQWYLVLLPLIFLANLVSQFIFAQMDVERSFQPILVFFTDTATPQWFRLWIVGIAVVIAPIVEEAFFRGVLMPVLLQRYRVWLPVAATALIFALVHGHLPSILPLFVFGLGLGVAYLYTGNLLVPIGIHALFNGVSLLLLVLVG